MEIEIEKEKEEEEKVGIGKTHKGIILNEERGSLLKVIID